MFGFSSAKQAQTNTRSEKQKRSLVSLSKFSKYALAIVVLVALLMGYFKLTAPQTFPIQNVKVMDLQQRVDQAELKQVVMPEVTKGFFNVNVVQLKQQVDLLPWVKQAQIKRIWPNTVDIQITEKQPAARWNSDELVTKQGDIFMPAKATIPQQLPQLNAATGTQQQTLKSYEEFQHQLEPLGLTITQMSVSERHDISLQINREFIIFLGQQNQSARLARFVGIYPEVFAGKLANLESVNMQYNHGMAVHWRGGT